jgi:tetratricopeptide (TPR) repeat protein
VNPGEYSGPGHLAALAKPDAGALEGEARPEPCPSADDRPSAAAEAVAGTESQRHSEQVLLADLDGMPPEEREFRVRNQRRFASKELAAALVERSHQARWRDAGAMLADARLAVAASEAAAATGREEEVKSLADCQARAWGQLANAHRVRGSLLEAEHAFAVTFRHLDEGTGDLGLRALLYQLLASLRRDRRQFHESAELFQRAIVLYRQLGDAIGEASALITLGITYIYAGDPESAVGSLTRCLKELDPQRHPYLMRAASHNLVRCYLDLGDPARAQALWAETESLFATCDDELALLRRKWHRGLIDRELGWLDLAESRLWEVREGFLRQGLPMESAIASLHLASVYLRQRRASDAVHTVGEIIPIFQSLGWDQELLASLTQLAEVAHDTRAALELLQQILRAVDRGADSRASSVPSHD